MPDIVATPQDATPAIPTVSDQIASLTKAVGDLAGHVTSINDTVDKIGKQPVYPNGFNPGMFAGSAPNIVKGGVGERGYSLMKVFQLANGLCTADEAKEEVQISNKLAKMYSGFGWGSAGGKIIVPMSSALMPNDTTENESTARECREKMAAGVVGHDPDEQRWIMRKAMGTISDIAGGSLVPAPALGELIELQRNKEVFPAAGARDIALPPSGRISFPKQTAGSTGYWVGEAASITSSDQATGSLLLEAKKAAVLCKINNELFRFANPTAESMIRMDMAEVAARLIDLAMLQGTGGTQIKGIITYSDIASITASTVGTNGNTFEPEDVARMEGALVDAVDGFSAYVMRRDLAAAITNRRADAVAAGDKKGQFVFNLTRSASDGITQTLGGTKLVKSRQVAATRTKGSATNLTYILAGYFPEWLIARLGVAEVLMSNTGDTPLVNDQTWIRCIQHIDAGPRHAASFVLCDQLVVQ